MPRKIVDWRKGHSLVSRMTVHLLGLITVFRFSSLKSNLFRYSYLLDEIKSETNSATQKLDWIKKAFVAYMQDYFYEAKVRLSV